MHLALAPNTWRRSALGGSGFCTAAAALVKLTRALAAATTPTESNARVATSIWWARVSARATASREVAYGTLI